MEYLDGRSLDSIVREEAPLDAERAIEITEQVLRAARFAHRRGVVHRDLKPHNVIVDEEGRVKVTDFGIARAGASEITQTGSIMGTARYLSPEQAQGQPVSPRSDLYVDRRDALRAADRDRAVRGRLGRRDRAAAPVGAAAPAELAGAVDLAARSTRSCCGRSRRAPSERFADADEFLAALDDERARIRGDSGAHTAALAPVVAAAADAAAGARRRLPGDVHDAGAQRR